MAKVERGLGEGEQIVLDLHPHWRQLILPLVFVPILVGVAAFAISAGPDKPIYYWLIVAVAVILLVLLSLLPFWRWQSTRYIVTNRRILYRSGIITRLGRDVPLYRMNDVHFENTLSDRLTGSGDLIIESAGEQGQLRFTNVPHVEDVQRVIHRLTEEDDQRRRAQ